jgi:hypothetical protein
VIGENRPVDQDRRSGRPSLHASITSTAALSTSTSTSTISKLIVCLGDQGRNPWDARRRAGTAARLVRLNCVHSSWHQCVFGFVLVLSEAVLVLVIAVLHHTLLNPLGHVTPRDQSQQDRDDSFGY